MSRYYIDIDDAIEIVTKKQGMWATTLHALCDAPKIDIVRCKECKNCRAEGNTTRFYWCHYWNKPTDLERYCSDGEREGE